MSCFLGYRDPQGWVQILMVAWGLHKDPQGSSSCQPLDYQYALSWKVSLSFPWALPIPATMVDGRFPKDYNWCFGTCSVPGLGVNERFAFITTTTNCLSSAVDASLVQVLARLFKDLGRRWILTADPVIWPGHHSRCKASAVMCQGQEQKASVAWDTRE